jgi:hypothetical protein
VFMLCSSRERGTVGSLRAFPFLIFWFEPLEGKRVEKEGESCCLLKWYWPSDKIRERREENFV